MECKEEDFGRRQRRIRDPGLHMKLQLNEQLFHQCPYTCIAAATCVAAATHIATSSLVVAAATLAIMSATMKNHWNTLNCNHVIWKTFKYFNLTTKILLYWIDLCVLTCIIMCIDLSWIQF